MKKIKRVDISDLIRENGFAIRPVVGTSMLPILRQERDAVRLVAFDGAAKIGDVLLYRAGKTRTVLHRVVEIRENEYVFRGDNCVETEIVPKAKIIAALDGFFRDGKYVSLDAPESRRYAEIVLKAGKPLIPISWRYVLKLYSAAIRGAKPEEVPTSENAFDEFDWNVVYSICKRQSIAAVVATAVAKLDVPPPSDVLKKFQKASFSALRREILFDAERERILAEFEAQKIPYVCLKGIVIKDFYPKKGTREFSDNDILYDKSRRKDVGVLMANLGYEVDAESTAGNQDVFLKKPFFRFEFHRELFSEGRRYKRRFLNVWNRALRVDANAVEYRFTDEDFCLYFLSHYAKHDENAGAGIRFLGDAFLIGKAIAAKETFDWKYWTACLKAVRLEDFEANVRRNVDDLFRDGSLPDDVLRKALGGGTFGSERQLVANAVANLGRWGYLRSKIFPPFCEMAETYPLLESVPFLLPWFYFVRCVEIVGNRKLRELSRRRLRILLRKG